MPYFEQSYLEHPEEEISEDEIGENEFSIQYVRNTGVVNLLAVLDAQRGSNNEAQPFELRIRLYRAITGQEKNINDKWMFEGALISDLYRNGFFQKSRGFDPRKSYGLGAVCNRVFNTIQHVSDAIYDKKIEDLPVFTDPANEKVKGVPVYVNPVDVIGMIERKRFPTESDTSKPAIAVLDVPLSELTGDNPTIKLIKKFSDPYTTDREVPSDDLVAAAYGQKTLSGDYYLIGTHPSNAGVPQSIREHEILVQPIALKEDGTVDMEKGFNILKK